MRELRNIRLRRGLSQADLSAKTGVAEYTISEIEAGKRTPRPSTLRKLAQGLGVEVADLYGEADNPLAKAPPSGEQQSFNNHLLEEERRIKWDAAVRSARQLREHGWRRMEEVLALWRESKERGEAKDARRDYLDEMGGLLDDALDARSALQKNASVPALDGIPLGKIPIPEFEEIAEADSLYWSLRNMVRGAGYLSIRPKRKPYREVHEVDEAA